MDTITRVTPEELLRLPDGKSYELVDGELKERHVSVLTSHVAAELVFQLKLFCKPRGLGWVLESENGYQCFENPLKVRRPDVSFVSGTRLRADEIGQGWLHVAPDLAIEVVSPNDSAHDLEEKLEDYRDAGVPVVWVVYPHIPKARIEHAEGTARHLSRRDEFFGEGPLEGFRCRFEELLPHELEPSE